MSNSPVPWAGAARLPVDSLCTNLEILFFFGGKKKGTALKIGIMADEIGYCEPWYRNIQFREQFNIHPVSCVAR